jgi:hypothetical protein
VKTLELSLTDKAPSHNRYDIVALCRGHEVLYYREFGGYEGEWLMISFCTDEYYIWKGYYGSCSGCDSYEAGLSSESTVEQALAFAKEYLPFIEVPKKTMVNLVKNETVQQILPANIRGDFEGNWDEIVNDLTLIVKMKEKIDISVPDIIKATDAEVKQNALKMYGYEKFVQDAGAQTVHSEGENHLIVVGGMKLLSLKDSSTPRRYLLRVPDTIERVKEGIAWTFNLNERDYKPIVET